MSSDCKAGAPPARTRAQARKASWPEGATVGLLLVAAACFGVSATIYHLAGPRDVFADEAAGR